MSISWDLEVGRVRMMDTRHSHIVFFFQPNECSDVFFLLKEKGGHISVTQKSFGNLSVFKVFHADMENQWLMYFASEVCLGLWLIEEFHGSNYIILSLLTKVIQP